MTVSLVSIGVAGSLGPDTIAELATHVERAGFHALWVNDTPSGDALAALKAAASTTTTLVLATGVIPIDRRPPETLVPVVRSMPAERVVIGIGAGGLTDGALEAVGDAADRLKIETKARVVIGALGPRMRRLAATRAHGALLSWLTPQAAAAQAEELRQLAPDTHVALYARTALDPAGLARRDEEARRYAGYPRYAANFERLGIDALQTVLPRPGEDVVESIEAYTAAVDELVLRAITPADGLDDYAGFVEQAAALLSR